jgi:hypothetical protein
MALREWQAALGQLVEARASGRELEPVLRSLDGLELSETERAWLRKVVGTPGFELTCYVPRWWRTTRVGRSARLTLAALGTARQQVLQAYLRATPCTTLFFASEGLLFLEYILSTAQEPHVRSLAQFEHALWTLKREGLGAPAPTTREPKPEELLAPSQGAAIVTFEASAEELLSAVLTGAPLPQAAEPHPVLIAPGLPHMWRPATAGEARAFQACTPPAPVGTVEALPDVGPEVLASLLSAGALVLRQP